MVHGEVEADFIAAIRGERPVTRTDFKTGVRVHAVHRSRGPQLAPPGPGDAAAEGVFEPEFVMVPPSVDVQSCSTARGARPPTHHPILKEKSKIRTMRKSGVTRVCPPSWGLV